MLTFLFLYGMIHYLLHCKLPCLEKNYGIRLPSLKHELRVSNAINWALYYTIRNEKLFINSNSIIKYMKNDWNFWANNFFFTYDTDPKSKAKEHSLHSAKDKILKIPLDCHRRHLSTQIILLMTVFIVLIFYQKKNICVYREILNNDESLSNMHLYSFYVSDYKKRNDEKWNIFHDHFLSIT